MMFFVKKRKKLRRKMLANSENKEYDKRVYRIKEMRKKKGGFQFEKIFGGLFIEKEKLEEAGIYYPIKLEYYKRVNEDEENRINNLADLKAGVYRKFGISVVKTEYMPNGIKVENKDVKYITSDEKQIDEILNIFKKNEVTPISVEDVISDLLLF